MCGLSLIFGTTVYISLKERILDSTKNNRLRKYLELSAILFVLLGYIWELRTPGINTAFILINSITSITAIALYTVTT